MLKLAARVVVEKEGGIAEQLNVVPADPVRVETDFCIEIPPIISAYRFRLGYRGEEEIDKLTECVWFEICLKLAHRYGSFGKSGPAFRS